MNKTKVVCTIGPASIKKEIMKRMIEKGMDVVRLNLSHGHREFCDEAISTIRELEKELNVHIGILIDTKGPETRIGKFQKKFTSLTKGSVLNIVKEDILNDEKNLSTDYFGLYDDISIGHRVLLNDGIVVLKVIDKYDEKIVCKVEKEGLVEGHSKVHFPDTNLNLPFLSDKDRRDIKYANDMDADFIALSMVNNKEDILEVNDILIEMNNDHLGIIAKIENGAAANCLDDIIAVSDGVMVARGDMGVELSMAKVPMVQKEIIAKCHEQGKISIVATEMMASMENHARPTGAEVADVANAVMEATDAVMLSGETTIGQYPVETVDIMNRIIMSAEEDINYIEMLDRSMRTEKQDITGAIAYSVVDSANRLKAKTIVATTNSGYTARKISRFRPSCPIIATSCDVKVLKSLTLNYGIHPKSINKFNSTDELVLEAKRISKETLLLAEKEKIIITGGFPVKDIKYTNFMKIEEI